MKSEQIIIKETINRRRPSKVWTEFDEEGAFKEASKSKGKSNQTIMKEEGPSEVLRETFEAARIFTVKSQKIKTEEKVSSRKTGRRSKHPKSRKMSWVDPKSKKMVWLKENEDRQCLTNTKEGRAPKMANRFNPNNPFSKFLCISVMHQEHVW